MIKSLKNKKKKGFTLIEIIAVIAIIAILAAVLVPKVTGYMKEARKTAVIDEARKVVTAAESVELKTGKKFPADASVQTVASAAGDLIVISSSDKIPPATPLTDCRKILDSENYSFTLDTNNKFSSVTTISGLN